MTTTPFQEPVFPPPDAGPPAAEAEAPDAPGRPSDGAPDAPAAVEAPYGYTIDAETGERRPKRAAGRRRKAEASAEPEPSGPSPSLDELKGRSRAPRAEDVPPEPRKAGRPSGGAGRAPEPVPPFRAGPIAKGVNRIYRRAGRIIRAWDPEMGHAIVLCTVKDEDDPADEATTVGEAWEEIAKHNPRIRAFLLKMVSGGAWGSLVAAHMPIVIALAMKDAVRRHLPMARLVDALLVDGDGQDRAGPTDLSRAMGGVGPADVAEMAAFAQQMMTQMGMDMPRIVDGGRPGTVQDYPEAG